MALISHCQVRCGFECASKESPQRTTLSLGIAVLQLSSTGTELLWAAALRSNVAWFLERSASSSTLNKAEPRPRHVHMWAEPTLHNSIPPARSDPSPSTISQPRPKSPLHPAPFRAISDEPARHHLGRHRLLFPYTRSHTCPLGIHPLPRQAAPPHRGETAGAACVGTLPGVPPD